MSGENLLAIGLIIIFGGLGILTAVLAIQTTIDDIRSFLGKN